MLELSDRRWDLQPEVEDLLLALETDVLWPSNHAGEVAGGLDVLADAIVAGTLLDERILRRMNVSLLRCAVGAKLDKILQREFHIPWGPSLNHRLFPEGMVRAPLSCPWVASCMSRLSLRTDTISECSFTK